MSIVTRLCGSNLSCSLRNTALPSVKSIGTIFKSKSLYTLPLIISRATLSTTSTPDVKVPVAPVSDVKKGKSVKSSALGGPSTSLRPMERHERIAFLEKTNIQKDIELSEISKEIKQLSAERKSLLAKIDKLTKFEERRLQIIEGEDLPDLRKDKDRLTDELSDNRKEINTLRTSLSNVQIEKAYLPMYLWRNSMLTGTSNNEPDSDAMFPMNNLGSFVLDRKRVINMINSTIKLQRDDYKSLKACQSIYINGCKGMGKTVTLALIAESLKSQGYEVYFFANAAIIPPIIVKEIESLLEDSLFRIAILVDEIGVNYETSALSIMLKLPLKNLVVIGAAVPSEVASGITAKFIEKINIFDLALKETDEDFIRLVDNLSGDDPVLAKDICFHILKYCGGHVLPTLSLIELFLSKWRNQFNTMDKFLNYFYGSELSKTNEFKKIKNRCFDLTSNNAKHVSRILGGVETSADIIAVEHVGWWIAENNHFISALIKNLCLECIQPAPTEEMILFTPGEFEENSELAIIQGFLNMKESDFKCLIYNDKKLPIEDALSYQWSIGVSSTIRNASLKFQESSINKGHVDFVLNGYANCAIEFIRNATLAKPGSRPQSTDIDEHLSRFISGKYHWKRFFIVNFSLKEDLPVLPSDKKYHDRVFTYVHSKNILYRGNVELSKPAVASLPCPIM